MTDGDDHEQQHCCLSHEFYRAATANPSKIAVVHANGGFRSDGELFTAGNPPSYEGDHLFTFSDVLASVGALTARLRSILGGAGDSHLVPPEFPADKSNGKLGFSENMYKPRIIGIYMPPSVEYIVSVLSVLRYGEAFLPLDPSWPRDRILSVLNSSNAALVIACEPSFGKRGCQRLDESHWLVDCTSCPVLRFSMEESVEQCHDQAGFVWPCEKSRKRLFCYLMYTSGSTGKPKGVCGTEEGLLNRFLWMQGLYPVCGEEILLFKTSISFIDHLQEILGATLGACTLVIPLFTKIKENIFSIIDFLQAYSISRLTAVPSLVRAMLPALKLQHGMRISNSLKLLVLSGEVLPLSLWTMLSDLLPKTSVLNLYGSTEVSGDCMYFDCQRLPKILEMEALTSVPIGLPILNCNIVLIGESDTTNVGEIYVRGLCVCAGFLCENEIMPLDQAKLHQDSICECSVEECGSKLYFRTGDFACRLSTGDLVFLGRKDRIIKVSGQRIALEEVENMLRAHCDVVDAAVISHKDQGDVALVAFILLQEKKQPSEALKTSIRNWMISKLPLAMVPHRFLFVESLPMSASGKVDYSYFEGSFSPMHVQDEISAIGASDPMQVINKAFCDALMVEEISQDDDFFTMGGNSILAAHVCHSLGINMRMLYSFPTPSKLLVALTEKKREQIVDFRIDDNLKLNLKSDTENELCLVDSATLGMPNEDNDDAAVMSKRLKVDLDKSVAVDCVYSCDGYPWNSKSIPISCSFSRCNKIMHEGGYEVSEVCLVAHLMDIPRNRRGFMHELWKVQMESCVDASPIVVFKDSDVYLFIGSHSGKFLCVNAKSGSVQWEVRLKGRVEGTAAIVSDFSQVVVGCYDGNIYFLNSSNGNINWTFQTSGEVKCQPVVDVHRQLIWCGSHDHNLYALDYKGHCCVYKLSCGGSIFGSPAIDELRGTLYVASTSGRVSAVSMKDSAFHTLWLHELEVPVFGSLSIASNRYVICCLVDGHVLALDSSGSIIWRCRTGGPVFAGACTSYILPSQVLICSRSGSVYSFELEKGDLLWELNVEDPITASAFVDENLQLISNPSAPADRLVCVCTSSGSIILLRVNSVDGKRNQPRKDMVQEFGKLELQGDVFSSPVMIGGRIYVGCRDDYLHCIAVETRNLVE